MYALPSLLHVQVMLRVSNLDKSIEYYEKCLGMQCLRKRDNEGVNVRTALQHSTGTCWTCNRTDSLWELHSRQLLSKQSGACFGTTASARVVLSLHQRLMCASFQTELITQHQLDQVLSVCLQRANTRWHSCLTAQRCASAFNMHAIPC